MSPPAEAPSISGAGPCIVSSLVTSAAWVKLLPSPGVLSSSLPDPPHAASANSAAPATTASGLPRLIVQPFLSLFVPTSWLVGNVCERLAARLRVKGVAHGVTQEVEGEHQGDDADEGLPEVERVGLEERHGLVDRLAPGRDG